jgi:(p)ppGpp synthase/HD superfamily hydrolase
MSRPRRSMDTSEARPQRRRSAPLGPRFVAALEFCVNLHRRDVRRGKSTPYVAHLLGVCSLVLEDGGNEAEAVAALLHDALEDHPERIDAAGIRARFGAKVLRMVQECTDTPTDYRGGPKPPWRTRKQSVLDRIAVASPGGRRVLLADKLHNVRDLLADVRREGARTWARFNAGRDDQLWYLGGVAARMKRAGQRGPMLDEFERVVAQLRRLS